MAIANPYASALQVNPQREQEELLKLKNNPQKNGRARSCT